MRFSLVLILVLATAAASGVGVFMGLQLKPELLGLPPVRIAPAKADPPVAPSLKVVTALGHLEPGTSVIGINTAPGSRIDQLKVKEHDRIAAGDVIAVLDTHDEMEAATQHAKALYDEARDRYLAETAHAKVAIEAADLKLREATEVLQKGIEVEEAAVRRVVVELEKARQDLGRSSRMLRDKAIPQSQFDNANLASRTLSEQLMQHRAVIAQLTQAREMKILLAKAERAGAETDLIRLQKAIPLDSLKAMAKLSETRTVRTIVRAPFAGEVLKIHTHEGETVGSAPILKMGDTSNMYVIAEIYETDAARVAPGQKVTVTSRAFPADKKLEGVVESISNLVHKKDVLSIDPAADSDARVLEARVKLTDSALAARFNHLQVDVVIDVGAH